MLLFGRIKYDLDPRYEKNEMNIIHRNVKFTYTIPHLNFVPNNVKSVMLKNCNAQWQLNLLGGGLPWVFLFTLSVSPLVQQHIISHDPGLVQGTIIFKRIAINTVTNDRKHSNDCKWTTIYWGGNLDSLISCYQGCTKCRIYVTMNWNKETASSTRL